MVALLAAVACGGTGEPNDPGPADPLTSALAVEVVVSGLTNPLYLTAPLGDSRLFVAEKIGRVRIVENGVLRAVPFLDLTARVSQGGEQGLLSIAFHPSYATNGSFYVNYTDTAGDTRVVRYQVSSDPSRADTASASLVLYVDQPFANHNGGHLLFGPDGMLYVPLGDGGSGGDPMGHGQNLMSLLGKLLRLDVNAGLPYAIPPGNPFVGRANARDEVWALGLRNPWRIAFDRAAGMLYIADVGQDRWEEVNAVAASAAGVNYGWNVLEASECYNASSCDRTGLTLPVTEYGRADGCSVTGGFVYRGQAIPGLRGHYLYSDFCRGWLRSFRYQAGQVSEHRAWPIGSVGQVLSFGEDATGELYLLSGNGNVYRIVKGG